MPRIVPLLAAICCLWLAGTGNALADLLSLQLTGTQGTSYGGVYVGPYTVSVNGTAMSLICDDYATDISQGQQWSATAVSGDQISSMKFSQPGAAFGNGATTATQAYMEVFWLSAQMLQPANSSSPAAIHYAIWEIMDPAAGLTGVPGTSSTPGSTSYWLSQASQNYASVNLAAFQVYVPSPLNTSQEFIAVSPTVPATVPLPAPVLLLGAGLIGLGGMRKRFKRQPV